ncbi:MAG TPA: sigma factor [Pseudonocardiaceae bacterium]|nr:sigma factor [Pseudonocardiaceae bacterium]
MHPQDDSRLTRRAANGDPAAFAEIVDRYAPHILCLCRNMLRRQADAEDCLRDVFVVAATRLAGLREPDRLRSWLFAVARQECLARLRKPDAAEPRQIIDAADLPARDRLALELADRQGLGTVELGEALGMRPASADKLLNRARANAYRSVGALLLARTARGSCAQLDVVLADWDGRLTPLLRERVARHVDECATCPETERRLDPTALFTGTPTVSVPFELRSRILDAAAHARHQGVPLGTGWRQGWPPGSRPLVTGRRVAVAAAVLALIALGIILGTVILRRPTAQVAAPPSSPTTAPATTTPQPIQTTSATAPAPSVDSATAVCVHSDLTHTLVPRLTWTTTNDTGINLFVNSKTTLYGAYPPTGTIDLPPVGCTPDAGQQTYTITTTGGTGKPATRTITLTPPATTTETTPPTTTSATTPTS